MRLYVGNLSPDVTEHEIAELFAGAGVVTAASVVIDRQSGKSRGFAYVELASDAEGERAMTRFNGFTLKGRPLVVNEAAATPPGNPRPTR